MIRRSGKIEQELSHIIDERKRHVVEHLQPFRSRYDDFEDTYNHWVKSKYVEEFESGWEKLKEKYHIEDDSWLGNMLKLCHHWVKAYLKDTFFGGMTTSERSESIHSFFDGFVNATTMLNEVVVQYDKAVSSRRSAKKDQDFRTLNLKPTLYSNHLIEEMAATCYTWNIYAIFKKEWKASFDCGHEILSADGVKVIYRVGFLKGYKEIGKPLNTMLLRTFLLLVRVQGQNGSKLDFCVIGVFNKCYGGPVDTVFGHLARNMVVNQKNKGYGLVADIWSLGYIVLEMLTRRIPYSPMKCMAALFRLTRHHDTRINGSMMMDVILLTTSRELKRINNTLVDTKLESVPCFVKDGNGMCLKKRHESGANNQIYYDLACKEYRAIYGANLTLTGCWKILKDHSKWKSVETPNLDLNDEADNLENVKGHEVRPMRRDKSKNKASSFTSRSESSVAGEAGLVEVFLNKWKNIASSLFTQRHESSYEYLRIKERELELKDLRRREQAEFERLMLAQEEITEQIRLAQQMELDEQRLAHC
ncbi:FAR1-related sequence 5-like protein [Tanacetum coccineum]